jgi:hypothetical protein
MSPITPWLPDLAHALKGMPNFIPRSCAPSLWPAHGSGSGRAARVPVVTGKEHAAHPRYWAAKASSSIITPRIRIHIRTRPPSRRTGETPVLPWRAQGSIALARPIGRRSGWPAPKYAFLRPNFHAASAPPRLTSSLMHSWAYQPGCRLFAP